MSEEEIILLRKKKKKEKKEYDYEAVAKRLKPLIMKWSNASSEFANEIHKEYLVCPNFEKLCQKLGCVPNTIYSLFDRYALQRKYPLVSDAVKEVKSLQKLQELESAVVEDLSETEIEDMKYKETYGILKNAQRLSIDLFNVPEKDELIEELQHTVKKLTTLLLKLESNLGD